ncbi:hypothetical protein GCM10007897_14860 [Sphingobium jiangsuense]|uniref:Uncharacterized protein n=1 Tax=Sphingobium jiangsuense TaxID=870476 RepID=A0A7W6BDT2_9SPHN|nr:hypothetical protein [Sphingobium jiangsuense]MBB3925070.1 hypothetical protein [Sphingobium jiangsuense]GLT00102.1 hypothetical protein GCM10007897_14860 [Sphingobium jiangsuense]
MQALNYTPKAIQQLLDFPCPDAPGAYAGMQYLARKLQQAEVFVLGDSGELLDRSKPRPEVPGVLFKPPFPVVALEYEANSKDWGNSIYTAVKASRRIALAWDWMDDLPPALAGWSNLGNQPGVAVVSISFFDNQQMWMPTAAAMFIPYETEYRPDSRPSPFRAEMIAQGRVSAKLAAAPKPEARTVALLPEAIAASHAKLGMAVTLDHISADLQDEVNAYLDLCNVLACRNVRAERQPASPEHNRRRIARGQMPLKDFHVLTIDGTGEGEAGATGTGTSPRAHLRRGHIRRLAPGRVTWVNATMVCGRGGFIDKAYAVRGVR